MSRRKELLSLMNIDVSWMRDELLSNYNQINIDELKLMAVSGHQCVFSDIPISENTCCMLAAHKWGGIVAYAIA